MSKRQLLTLTMTVRDEEAGLPRTLASVSGIVDEIVVADTGSSDRTIDIARSLGAKVVEVPWEDSFAAARNRSLALATGDWVLILDPDEEFPPGEAQALRRLLESTPASAVSLLVETVGSLENPRVPSFRAWRNRPDYRYRGRICELPDFGNDADEPGFLLYSSLRILHRGYEAANLVARDKLARNRQLLELQYAETPDDPMILFFLARIAGDEGRDRDEEELLRRAVEHDGRGAVPAATRNLANLLAFHGRLDEAWRVVAEGLSRFPEFADLWFAKASLENATGDLAAAADSYRQTLALAQAPGGRYPETPQIAPAAASALANLEAQPGAGL